MLRAEAHRLAVLLAVEEQVTLIAFEHGPRDLYRIGDAAFLAPVDELPEQELAVADCLLGVVLDGERLQVVAHHDLQRDRWLRFLFAWCDNAGHSFTSLA